MKKRTKIIIAVFISITAALLTAAGIYSNDYYRAVDVEKYIISSKTVTVNKIKEGYFFDGYGEDNALIFYPGAKVEETAYAPMMRDLAEQGVDCFLIKMPMKLAFFDSDKAENIIDKYKYENYYFAGHSLGGAIISDFVSNNRDKCSGLFLLGAYSMQGFDEAHFPVVFIYGDNDKILSKDKVECDVFLEADNYEFIKIQGGNHSNFGSYGFQKGDGKAKISAEKQQKITTDKILDTVNKNMQ